MARCKKVRPRQCGAQSAAACAARPYASGSQPRAMPAACQEHGARQRAVPRSVAVAPLHSTATPSPAARARRSSACTAAGTQTGSLRSWTCPITFYGAQVIAPVRLATGRPATPGQTSAVPGSRSLPLLLELKASHFLLLLFRLSETLSGDLRKEIVGLPTSELMHVKLEFKFAQ